MRAAHSVIASVEAQQVLIILLLLAAGAGQAVIPRQAPLYAVLFDPAAVITFHGNEGASLLKIVKLSDIEVMSTTSCCHHKVLCVSWLLQRTDKE